jgi:hypothetical protein
MRKEVLAHSLNQNRAQPINLEVLQAGQAILHQKVKGEKKGSTLSGWTRE